MMNAKSDWPLRIGLLFVALAWFSFTFYEFTNGIINRGPLTELWIMLTDVPGCIGLGFRTVAGFIAVITILFYIVKRNLSVPEALMSLRWVVILEGANFVSLFPSAMWGMSNITNITSTYSALFLVETGLPVLVESIAIPFVLVKLFFELNPKKSARGAIKWGLISGTIYLFVFWLNNTCNWIGAIMDKGIEYVSLYPINLFSFGITAVGLLLLALFAAYFSKRSFREEVLTKLDLKRIGVIITALGLYFNVIYVLWLFFGSVGGWSMWYAWFLNHNMDLWALSLPFVGLPLLFHKQA